MGRYVLSEDALAADMRGIRTDKVLMYLGLPVTFYRYSRINTAACRENIGLRSSTPETTVSTAKLRQE